MHDLQDMEPPEEVQWDPNQVLLVFKRVTNLSCKNKVKFRSFYNDLFALKVMEMELFPMDMDVDVNLMVIEHI